MKNLLLLLLLLLTILSARASAEGPMRKGTIVGGWRPIEDLSDPHIVDIAKFAVAEHNKEANSNLGFGRVVSGESQVVSGVNYKLVLVAKDATGKDSRYEAVVWEQAWLKFRKLTSFKPIAK